MPHKTKSDNIYCHENIQLFETLYGKNLISLGGVAAIDNMFSGLEIKGLNALDLGFGLGGVAFYLVEHYDMKITGIELQEWMVKYAKVNTPKKITTQLKFFTYKENDRLPVKTNSFDLVYSKGVLNHVKDKISLFQQIYLVLKPNAQFVIADWIVSDSNTESSPYLVNETKESYTKVFEKTGFTNISFRNDSKIFVAYVENFIDNLMRQQVLIEHNYGKELFLTILEQHQRLLKNIIDGKKIAVRILATKAAI